jgi:hypothetical protein
MSQILQGRFDGSNAAHRNPSAPPEFPRERYTVDAQGKRVLPGLTAAETKEFKMLDSLSPSDGENIGWTFGGEPTTRREKRWLELYTRHNEAWRARNGNSPAATLRPRLRLVQQESSGATPGKPTSS